MERLGGTLALGVLVILSGCAASDMGPGAPATSSVDVLGTAGTVAGDKGAGELISSAPSISDAFCLALIAPTGQSYTQEDVERIFSEASSTLKAKYNSSPVDQPALEKVIELSCSIRSSADSQSGDLWAWNEYDIGAALLLIGRAQAHPATLKVATAMSSSAANAFAPSSEGWGWSRQNVGQSASELWQLEGTTAYLDIARDAFGEVANSTTPAAPYSRAELERLN